MRWHCQWLSFSGDNGIGAPRGRVLHARFPCLIRSCGWHRVSEGKEPNYPAALAGCATVGRGQKLIPSSSPVPPTQGAGLARLAFCVRLSGGVKGREQESRGWSNHQRSFVDRRTDRCLGLVLPPSLSPRLCLRHTGKGDDGTPAHTVYNPHVTMRRILTTLGPGHRAL